MTYNEYDRDIQSAKKELAELRKKVFAIEQRLEYLRKMQERLL